MKNLAARSGIHKSHSRSLRQFCEDYIVDPWKNYTFSAKGQKQKSHLKQMNSTCQTQEQSKPMTNLFGAMASKLESKSSRKNRSPLRQRKLNKNHPHTASNNEKKNHFVGVQQIQSKVHERKKVRSAFPKQSNQEFYNHMEQIQSQLVPTKIDLDLSFQNFNQNFSSEPRIEHTAKIEKESFGKDISAGFPTIIEEQHLENAGDKKQSSIHVDLKDHCSAEKNSWIHPTDSEYQQLKNPYAEEDKKSLKKSQVESDDSKKGEDIVPTPNEDQQKAIGVDDLDINNLIKIDEGFGLNSPIKLIEEYQTEFKQNIIPKTAQSHLYEAPKCKEEDIFGEIHISLKGIHV